MQAVRALVSNMLDEALHMRLPLRPDFLLYNEIPNARSEVSVLFSAL